MSMLKDGLGYAGELPARMSQIPRFQTCAKGMQSVKNVGGQLRSRTLSLFIGNALDERSTLRPSTFLCPYLLLTRSSSGA